jgi:hypothetical protein
VIDNKSPEYPEYPCADCGTLDTGRAGHFDGCAKKSPAPPRETTGKNFRILDGAAMPPDVDISDTQWALVEYDGDQMVRIVGVDGGEPEDQTLVRDWNWVAVEMNALARQLRASEDARRKAEELKDSYKAERDEYAKSATALRAQLATVTAERDALHGKLLVANAGWDSSQNSLVLAQTARARAEAALATVTTALTKHAVIQVSGVNGDHEWCQVCNRYSTSWRPAREEPRRVTHAADCALAAAPRAGETSEETPTLAEAWNDGAEYVLENIVQHDMSTREVDAVYRANPYAAQFTAAPPPSTTGDDE